MEGRELVRAAITHRATENLHRTRTLQRDEPRLVGDVATLVVRLPLLREVPDDLLDVAEESRFTELPVTSVHALELRNLPMLHNDPFDRLLVAQARAEGLTIVTVDEKVAAYPISTVLA